MDDGIKPEEPPPKINEFGMDEEIEETSVNHTEDVAIEGQDEEDVIDKIYQNFGKEAQNALGEPTGEKLLIKEDAMKAGAQVMTVLRGLKGAELDKYMKDHFEESWKAFDVNEEGSITFDESHTFQRALMGKTNKYVKGEGSVIDLNATNLDELI